MHGWLTLANFIGKVLSSVLKLLERKQLMDAGEARAVAAAHASTLKRINAVRIAHRDPAYRERVRTRLRKPK